MKYPHNLQTKSILAGCPDFVRREGLNYLVPAWEQYCELYRGRTQIDDSIYEFLNDLDARHLIFRTLQVIDSYNRRVIEKELEPYDNLFRRNTEELDICCWGVENEVVHHWNRQDNWYYYRAPITLIEQNPTVLMRKT